MSIRIAFVDDHTLVREGFRGIMQLDQEIDIDSECATFEEAQAYLETTPALDAFIVDISLGDHTGFELIKQASQLGIKSLVVSMHVQEPYISEAIHLGASGYISKASAADDLIKGIHAVSKGKIYYSKDVENYLSTVGSNPMITLTQRELDVCRQLLNGTDIKRIGLNLGISAKTVYVHRSNVFEKLEITSEEQLFKLARKFGLDLDSSL
jgi:DNA-binding NarL/FixJ family response regulator